jgi:hypothetical protein
MERLTHEGTEEAIAWMRNWTPVKENLEAEFFKCGRRVLKE